LSNAPFASIAIKKKKIIPYMENLKAEIESQIQETNDVLKKVFSKVAIDHLYSADLESLTMTQKRVNKLCITYKIISTALMVMILPALSLKFFVFEKSWDIDRILVLVMMLSLFSLYKYLRYRTLNIGLNRKIGLLKILNMLKIDAE
jgi:hypothetical protein